MRLLEVPGEKVTASSAAFALQRLSQLCSATGNDDMDSFVRRAVLHELCETVVQGLSQLPNSTIVSLAGHAALASSGYDEQFVRHVNDEVSNRHNKFTKYLFRSATATPFDLATLKFCACLPEIHITLSVSLGVVH